MCNHYVEESFEPKTLKGYFKNYNFQFLNLQILYKHVIQKFLLLQLTI